MSSNKEILIRYHYPIIDDNQIKEILTELDSKTKNIYIINGVEHKVVGFFISDNYNIRIAQLILNEVV